MYSSFVAFQLFLLLVLASFARAEDNESEALKRHVFYSVDFMSSSWTDHTTDYFTASSSTTDASIHEVRFLTVADWYNTMNPNLIGIRPAHSPLQLELWGSSAITNSITRRLAVDGGWMEDGATELQFRWRFQPIPAPATLPKGGGNNTIVSTLTADFTRRGLLDFIVQDAQGELYYVNGNEDVHRETSTVESSRPLDVYNPLQLNLAFKHPQSPQIGLANLISPCGAPDLTFVNSDGDLILLTLRVQRNSSDAGRFDDNCVFVGIGDKATLDPFPQYEAYLLSTLVRDSFPLDIRPGRREINPFSLTIEDINGDCQSELVFTIRDLDKEQVEVFAVSAGSVVLGLFSEQLLVLDESGNSDHSFHYYGTPTITDVSGDGVGDLVFPACINHVQSDPSQQFAGSCSDYEAIVVFPSRMRGSAVCATSSSSGVLEYGFDAATCVISLLVSEGCGLETSNLIVTLPSSLQQPLLLRSFDYNRDGVLDLLVPSSEGPLVLTSQGGMFFCSPVDASKVEDEAYRTAVPFSISLGELGRFDIVLNHAEEQWNSVYVHPSLSQRHYFLLASALNGVFNKKANRFSLTQVGAVHHYAWQDMHMEKQYSVQTQSSRTVGRALAPPRVFTGLGLTNSYIEDYTVGVTSNGRKRYRRWPSYLVPNSQVFAVLHPMEDDSKWTLQLYVPTSQYKVLLLVSLITILVLLGIPIVCLRWGEIRSDIREWRLQQ